MMKTIWSPIISFQRKKFDDNAFIIKSGLQLYNRKIRDYACMQIMVDAMAKGGYKQEKIEPYLEEMSKLYPDKVSA